MGFSFDVLNDLGVALRFNEVVRSAWESSVLSKERRRYIENK